MKPLDIGDRIGREFRAIGPGSIRLTPMPLPASSILNVSESASSANLEGIISAAASD